MSSFEVEHEFECATIQLEYKHNLNYEIINLVKNKNKKN